MILSGPEIREAVEKGDIKFEPPIEERQWGAASVDLRLGFKFTKFKQSDVIVPLAKGIRYLPSELWTQEELPLTDAFGKRVPYILDREEFILAQTYERIWVPSHLIARVEGRSTYARFGISMHETAPWLQPGWDGHITLELRNSGPARVELLPRDDMPCQVTFFRLSQPLPAGEEYGSRPSDSFQHQTSPIPTDQPETE